MMFVQSLDYLLIIHSEVLDFVEAHEQVAIKGLIGAVLDLGLDVFVMGQILV